MRWSDERILTTHTGSLPRPPELTRLYVRRARGEAIDPAELDRVGKAALRRIVDKQIEAGVDIGNNGEQQREAFFLYVRHRMSGFGDSWQRWPRGDVERYPLLKQQMAQMLAAREAVGNYQPPKAIGEVRYVDDTELNTEIADFRTALEAKPTGFVEPFMTAPSPGIIAAAMKNEYYDSEEAYLAAIAAAIQVEYEAIVKSGFLLQLDCPDLALEGHLTYNDRPIGEFLAFIERVVAAINKAIVNVPRDRVRLHVCWGNYEGPHDRDVPLAEILPLLEQANVGGFVLPFANPRHQHEYRVLQQFPLADDQIIAAGVIDDLTGFVEHPEVVADRLENVARAVGDPRRVMACTDCGFDTSAGMGRVTEDVVWAKLAAMSADYSICLGTAGWGVWHSPDAGKSWIRHRVPFPLNSRIQALVVHPTEAHTVLAGGDTGLFVSHNGGARWERITANGANGANGALPTIWSLTIDPVDPDILFAGTRPAAVYRSRDGGLRWEKLAVDIARECSIGIPFVTSVIVDPDDHRMVWAGVEIDGVFRSLDGGDSWTHLETGLYDPDIHAVAIAATQPKRIYASTAREMFVSDNLGETWQPLGIKQKWPLPYARGMVVKADDPSVLFAGCGETTTGEKGHVLRTTNFGETWQILPLPTQPNATLWGLATHPADANRIVAFSLFGEVYVTEDAGASWRKIAREFGEIRTAAWLPN